jgi:hypothetical protein
MFTFSVRRIRIRRSRLLEEELCELNVSHVVEAFSELYWSERVKGNCRWGWRGRAFWPMEYVRHTLLLSSIIAGFVVVWLDSGRRNGNC